MAALFVLGPHDHRAATELRLAMCLEGMMLDEVEIARLKSNLDCSKRQCDWHEAEDGVAWCKVCGSGFLPYARVILKERAERADAAKPVKKRAP